ncbi:ferredoxin [Lactococcus hodotermopsidis]|uniref:Ferredoxin n=1 Tax=Pseudolactococcus hodotermopsidis TaxID=2709157 RepID=A0A6A0BDC5_9LACT|nr:ferredoxin [Lactococcus hodotermopsidis]GFH42665.1 ferredoxin [Lactococcus hodotermopsidis]
MNLKIFPENCIACGLCHTYNTIFDYDDNGLVRLVNEAHDLTLPHDPSIISAAKNCPTQAILVKSD